MSRRNSPSPQSAREVRERFDGLEAAIDELKVRYEKYFLGLDKRPPSQEHERVRRTLRELEKGRYQATALRFRLNSLRSRLVTYEHYWSRILRQIEEGTYKRHLDKAERLRRQRAERAQREKDALPPEGERRARPRRDEGPVVLPDGVDPAEVRALYKDLVRAKKAAGEPIEGLSYGRLVRKLAQDLPRLRDKHGTDVRLEVYTRDGKVRMRARPKKPS